MIPICFHLLSKRATAIGILVAGLASGAVSSWAAPAGSPEAVKGELPAIATASKAVLTVSAAGKTSRWTLAQLEGLGMYRVKTHTFWPDDDGTYEGPRLLDVLKAAGLDPKTKVRVLAKDGFSQTLPVEDLQTWPLILATRRDGAALDVRHKGPLRIIYPRDMDERLSDPVYRLRWVWMVQQIESTP